MRLNRVLLLAATISIMMFALVFTISCSGEDGKNGRNGTGCTVDQDDNGDWNIICDGDQVGVMHNGDGVDGAQGIDGKNGADGENCKLSKVGYGYEVRCGEGNGVVKGTLEGCTVLTDIEENPHQVTLRCGKNPELNLCNLIVFDPKKQYCKANGDGIENGVLGSIAYCGGEEYNESIQSCGFGLGDKEKYDEAHTIYTKCGGEEPNADEYNPEEYCRYYSKTIAHLAGVESAKDWCNGEPLNKDGWNGEYCGYASQDTKVKSVLTGACDEDSSGGSTGDDDDGIGQNEGTRGPNEIAFGQGYCVVKRPNRTTGFTTYTEALCGTSENNKPNNGAWKNEYCGFASESSVEPTKVYQGLCDDSFDENDETVLLQAPHFEGYNKGYCQAVRNDSTYYKDAEEFCGDGGKPNEWTWKGEYCGAASENSSETILYSGICDDNHGPNEEGWNPNEYCQFERATNSTVLSDYICDNGDKVNEGSWKKEYCGHASLGAPTSSIVGACDNEEEPPVGPHSDEFNGGYCEVQPADRLTGKTTLSDNFCITSAGPKTINEGKWKGEYCGYTNANSDENDKVWTGACDNGDGKNRDEFGKAGWCRAENSTSGTVWSSDFCATNKTFNSGSWKGEYCFIGGGKEGVAKCNAGFVAKEGETAYSASQTTRCILPAADDRCTGGEIGGIDRVAIVLSTLATDGLDADKLSSRYSDSLTGTSSKCFATLKNATNAIDTIETSQCKNSAFNPTRDGTVQNYCVVKSTAAANPTTGIDADGDCRVQAQVPNDYMIEVYNAKVKASNAASVADISGVNKSKTCEKISGAKIEKVTTGTGSNAVTTNECYYPHQIITGSPNCQITKPASFESSTVGQKVSNCTGTSEILTSVCSFTP